MILSAALMLEWFAENPFRFPEMLVYLRSETPLEGCYSFQDSYLWSGFVDDQIFAAFDTHREETSREK